MNNELQFKTDEMFKEINKLYSRIIEYGTKTELTKFSERLSRSAKDIENNLIIDNKLNYVIKRIQKLSNNETKKEVDLFCNNLTCVSVNYESADCHRFESVKFIVNINNNEISISYCSDIESITMDINNIRVLENSDRTDEWEDYKEDDDPSTFEQIKNLFVFKTIDVMSILHVLVD
jgi:hypothetical protein